MKIGVIGTGHLGKIHLNCIQQAGCFDLIGCHDTDLARNQEIAQQMDIKAYPDAKSLIQDVDILDIVTPTTTHFQIAEQAMKNFRHVFIEKPLVETIDQAKSLLQTAEEADVKVQVGHVERFNPAFLAARELITAPAFIECHRMAQYNSRGTDVSVVLDLMIHDIDIVLSTVKSPVKRIHATGIKAVSQTADMANARIEFENGTVASLTASRIAVENIRKSRFYSADSFIAVDFLNKKAHLSKINPQNPKEYQTAEIEVTPVNSIVEELVSFHSAIKNNQKPIVSLNDGYLALETARKIEDKIS